MSIKIKLGKDNDYKPKEQIPASVDRWFDRQTRLWVVQLKDTEGIQIGNAYYTADKTDAIAKEKDLIRKHLRPKSDIGIEK